MSTLVVEDGTGKSNSNAYADYAFFTSFLSERPAVYRADFTNASQPDAEAALIWATRLLDEQVKWRGYKINQTQALQWPRFGVFDRGGWQIANNTIPTFLEQACCELAAKLLAEDWTDEPIHGVSAVSSGGLAVSLDKGDPQPILPRSVKSLIPPSCGQPYGGASVRLVRA